MKNSKDDIDKAVGSDKALLKKEEQKDKKNKEKAKEEQKKTCKNCDIEVNLKSHYSASKPTQFTDDEPYTHRVPEQFSPGSDFLRDWERYPNDKLMFDLITHYAREGKKESDGKPSGQFFVDRSSTRKAILPYIKKYLPETEKDPKALEAVMQIAFEDEFQKIDVNDTGYIECE